MNWYRWCCLVIISLNLGAVFGMIIRGESVIAWDINALVAALVAQSWINDVRRDK